MGRFLPGPRPSVRAPGAGRRDLPDRASTGRSERRRHFFERYRSGDKLPNSGRLRISVAPERATVEYLRAGSPLQQGGAATPDQAAFRYELLPRPQP